MSVVLQISDPHFGTEQPLVVEALALLARTERPDLVVLSGDITQRALPAQFGAARAFIDRLAVPTLTIPGNHDIPLYDIVTRMTRPYARYSAAFGHELEPVHSSRDLLVACVNTTRPWRHKNGEVSQQQVERVARRISQAGQAQLRVVVVHQPIEVMRAADVHDRLRGHASALRAWAEAGADVVMGGHIHLPYVTVPHGLPRRLVAVQAGTAVSSRVREGVPNSVNLLRCGADAPTGRFVVERWDHSAAQAAFVRQSVEVLPLDRAGDGP